MESFEKRQRERKKQEQRKEKAARKLQGLEASGPSEADYFADLSPAAGSVKDNGQRADDAQSQDAKTPPPIEGGAGA